MDVPNERRMAWRAREDRIAFRPLTFDDIPLLLAWLSDPDVEAWYREGELTLGNIRARYAPMIEGRDSTRPFIFQVDGRDAGYIQTYRIDDEPDYARQLDVPPGCSAVDLMVGDPRIRGKGWAVPMLRGCHRRYCFGEMGVDLALIAPHPANERAIHVYEQVGFRGIKTVPIVDDDPDNTGPEYVMLMTREEFFARDPD